jgi:hypothetical protein
MRQLVNFPATHDGSYGFRGAGARMPRLDKFALAALIPMRNRASATLSDNILEKQWCRTKTIAQNHRNTMTIHDSP